MPGSPDVAVLMICSRLLPTTTKRKKPDAARVSATGDWSRECVAQVARHSKRSIRRDERRVIAAMRLPCARSAGDNRPKATHRA